MLTPLYKSSSTQCPGDLTDRCHSPYFNCPLGDSERRCPTYCSVLSLGESGSSSWEPCQCPSTPETLFTRLFLPLSVFPPVVQRWGSTSARLTSESCGFFFSPPKPGDGGGDLNHLYGGCLHCQLAVILGSPLRETSGCV